MKIICNCVIAQRRKIMSDNNRQINHEYKNGRYNPAAVNRKQDRTVYHKQTTIKKIDSSDEMKLRKKRGGKNGRTKK